MEKIQIRDVSTSRSDRYALETVAVGTDVGIATGAEAITGTNASALVSAKALASAMAAPMGAVFTVGTEGTNAITVNIQLNDGAGTALAVRASLFAYLSDDANGDSIVASAPDGGWAAGTDGVLIPVVAGKAAQLVSEADGDIDVVITESGTKTSYLILVLPTGKLAASGAITFAA